MKPEPFAPWQCPLCGEPLTGDTALKCGRNHSFDRAKERYWHLLPVQSMRTKAPGDSKEMVAARRAFLNAGYYGIFGRALGGAVSCVRRFHRGRYAAPPAGCGLRRGLLHGQAAVCLHERGVDAWAAGFDISKVAVRMAAKRYPSLELAVGSAYHMPVADRSVDCLTSVFAPIVPGEFARVTKPGGVLILAVAAPRHLFQLKEAVYAQPYENETKDTAYAGFTFLKRVPVRGEITLKNGNAVRDLFTMTPYHWKTSVEDREKLEALTGLTTEIGFDFVCYRRQEG